MATTEKALPHNRDAERSVLGAILIENAKLSEMVSAVPSFHSGDFFDPHHRMIFAQMLAMAEEQHPIDDITLIDALAKSGKLDGVGGPAYIASLADGVPRGMNVVHYARIIKEKSELRIILRVTENIQQRAFEDRTSVFDLQSQLSDALKSVGQHAKTNGNGNGHRHAPYSLMEFLKADFPVPEHLVENLIPKGGSVLVVAMPHRLKSWLTTGLALSCTRAGKALGALDVPKGFRTLIVQVEEHESDLKWRIRELMKSSQFHDCDPSMVRIVGRSQFDGGFTREWANWLRDQVQKFEIDLVIMDVLRRFMVGRGDINSPGDTQDFLEEIDEIRDCRPEKVAVALVHHENRKDAELMAASAGSYNLPGWANTVIQLKRKTEHGTGDDRTTSVEIEYDSKLAKPGEALRLVLQLNSPSAPLRVEEIGDGDDWTECRDQLGDEWTVRDLSEILGVHRTSALRRLNKWIKKGIAQKVVDRKRGKMGGHARYTFVDGAA